MLKIICPNCDKENTFQSRGSTPFECSFCFTSFPSSITISETAVDGRGIIGLTIIYQINQQRLEISTLRKTTLGRENFGASVFSKIFFNGKPVVSRKHCSIEYKDGKFYLIDEDSLNGTFYGVNKISCKNTPQVIEDKSIFYIGEEAFLAQINYQDTKHEETSQLVMEIINETKTIKQFRCRSCGNNFEEFSDDCPICDRYNSLIPIYE
jgi:protein-arginine kinase activator protein McsA